LRCPIRNLLAMAEGLGGEPTEARTATGFAVVLRFVNGLHSQSFTALPQLWRNSDPKPFRARILCRWRDPAGAAMRASIRRNALATYFEFASLPFFLPAAR